MKKPTIGHTVLSDMKCLNCQSILSCASSIDHDEAPHKGAITICVECQHVMAFDEQLQFRELNDEEIIDMAGDEVLLKAMKAAELIKLETDIKKEVVPKLDKLLKTIKIETKRVEATDGSLGWLARDITNQDSEIGCGESEDDAVRDLMIEIFERLIREAHKHLKRNRS
jgi:hypothetical protein